MTWQFPLHADDLTNLDRLTSPQGVFGYKRSYYFHQGVDLYVTGHAEVMAVEAGTVVAIEKFTGPPEHPHWNYTQAILVEGASGVVCYGEVEPKYWLSEGDKVETGDVIANVVPVLPDGMERPDIHGHSRYMLHFELYTAGTKESVDWRHEEERPENLLDPTSKLTQAWKRISA